MSKIVIAFPLKKRSKGSQTITNAISNHLFNGFCILTTFMDGLNLACSLQIKQMLNLYLLYYYKSN